MRVIYAAMSVANGDRYAGLEWGDDGKWKEGKKEGEAGRAEQKY